MKELEQLLELNKDIDTLLDKLAVRRYGVIDPKRQIISDMPKPKGGCRINAIEDYIINAETIHNEIEKLFEELKIKWIIFLNNYEEAKLTVEERELLNLRFVQGQRWKFCAAQMNILYPFKRWNESKVYRTYKNIIKKIEKYYN